MVVTSELGAKEGVMEGYIYMHFPLLAMAGILPVMDRGHEVGIISFELVSCGFNITCLSRRRTTVEMKP